MTKLASWLLPTALALSAITPAQAQSTLVDLGTALRCSAAFAIMASEQERGTPSAVTDYPPMKGRGREFFVQTGARLMDEQKLTREQVQQRFKTEFDRLQGEVGANPASGAILDRIMTPCLTLLDATVPLAPSRRP